MASFLGLGSEAVDTTKTKEQVLDFRRRKSELQSISINVRGKGVQLPVPGCAHRHRSPLELKHLRGCKEGPNSSSEEEAAEPKSMLTADLIGYLNNKHAVCHLLFILHVLSSLKLLCCVQCWLCMTVNLKTRDIFLK